jgi:membrane protein DedA with SNARE-associated domain
MSPEFFQHPAGGFEMWPGALIFLSTFVLEDVAAVGAGLLLAAGTIAWPTAFAACFLGIWMGDAGLYGLARFAGRNFFERTSLRRFSRRVEQSERWFSERGDMLLVSSRLLPGARLPTYLAAGFLRLPFDRFLVITGGAAFLWTLAILSLTNIIGVRLLVWLGALQKTGWVLLLCLPLLLVTLHFLKRLLLPGSLKRIAVMLARWRHWEFWPMWLFYPPVAANYFWLAIKYRGCTLPTAANPGIFSGGLVGESKMVTLADLMATSPDFTVETELPTGLTVSERLESLREICSRRGIDYPFILKPDFGQRGAGVKLIRSEAQARDYLKQTYAPLLVQRHAAGPGEVGIFYYRFPGEPHGRIFSITEKVFPTITGDGLSTISELVWKDERARFLADKYLQRFTGRENEILPAGEALKLVEAGNHAQGCIFRDGMRLNSPALESRIDAISQKLTGFYIGRYDIRFASEADLRDGINFQIIELNGAASEAASIYDARNSLLSAYRTLFRQWELVFAIGAANRRRGCVPTKLPLLWKKWREYLAQAATYPAAD